MEKAPVRLGVIGLGRLWEGRHRPALAAMKDRFRVVAVYDQVLRRAELEADSLGCVAAVSVSQLVRRDDVDVVSLLAPQWFGLHAAMAAVEAGKALYLGVPLAADVAALERLAALARQRDAVVVPELPRRLYPVTVRLRELVAGPLGRLQLIVGHTRLFGFDRASQPGPSAQLNHLPLLTDPGFYLVDWCRFVLGDTPTATQAFGAATGLGPDARQDNAGDDFLGFVLDFPSGAQACLTATRLDRKRFERSIGTDPAPGVQVYCERGTAWIEPPERIVWRDAQGEHDERLPQNPALGEALHNQLHRCLFDPTRCNPTLDDALVTARVTQAIGRSRLEGRRIELSADAGP